MFIEVLFIVVSLVLEIIGRTKRCPGSLIGSQPALDSGIRAMI
jgi:hypothetical protein